MIQFKENVHTDNKRTSRTYFIRLFWLLLTRIKKKTKLLCLLFEMNQSYFITHPANFEKFRHTPCPSSTKIEGFKIHHFERSTLALQEDCCLQKQEEDQKRVEIRIPSYLIAGKWNYDTNLLVCLIKKLRWDLKYYIFFLKICQCMSLFFQLALKFSFCNQGT